MVVNLFDVAMVFAVALMVAMVMHMNMTEVFTQEDFTIVKNPGKDNMEIIMKEGNKINKYTPSAEVFRPIRLYKKQYMTKQPAQAGKFLFRVWDFPSIMPGW